ncbi:hypothetical protein ZOD2009_11775 [Haladaptatus paucihalophilus DX253]|uniref:Uncharacterized protein n=1 Tax=Haladaptatus paucihalophilus DX253 TaxID=797209 RepID=E7QU75_HALPU|nr:hypothetical protein ZOD2009_11775 [Haladaptatus paucihalophilus DX253]
MRLASFESSGSILLVLTNEVRTSKWALSDSNQ